MIHIDMGDYVEPPVSPNNPAGNSPALGDPTSCRNCLATRWEYDRDPCSRAVCPMRPSSPVAVPPAAEIKSTDIDAVRAHIARQSPVSGTINLDWVSEILDDLEDTRAHYKTLLAAVPSSHTDGTAAPAADDGMNPSIHHAEPAGTPVVPEAAGVVVRQVQDKLADLSYIDRGGVPFVERELIFIAVNDVAKEIFGGDWVTAMSTEKQVRDENARLRAEIVELMRIGTPEWEEEQATAQAEANSQRSSDEEWYDHG